MTAIVTPLFHRIRVEIEKTIRKNLIGFWRDRSITWQIQSICLLIKGVRTKISRPHYCLTISWRVLIPYAEKRWSKYYPHLVTLKKPLPQQWYLIKTRKQWFAQMMTTPNCSPLSLESWNGPAVRVFANGPGDLDSIPGRVIPKTLKMVLDTTLLNTQHYKVRFKGKVEQSWEWSSALPYTLV